MNKYLRELNIDEQFIANYKLPLQKECKELIFYGYNPYDKLIFLNFATFKSWSRLNSKAKKEGINMEIFSGFRSIEHQANIIKEKIRKQIPIEKILHVSALPGYSEHHTGFALDLYQTDKPDLNQEFANSDAFKWLSKNAHEFNFYLSYPENNTFGIIFEPWHWCYQD